MKKNIKEQYFKWLTDQVCKNRFAPEISYMKLLNAFYDREFEYWNEYCNSMARDENRAEDGIALRHRFADDEHVSYDFINETLNEPCNMLEMMVALALRCEETLMDDPRYGNRTAQWFWSMVTSLGLGGMYDSNYDNKTVKKTLTRFMNREYDRDGHGGLFLIPGSPVDLRRIEIWYQLCRYIDSIF